MPFCSPFGGLSRVIVFESRLSKRAKGFRQDIHGLVRSISISTMMFCCSMAWASTRRRPLKGVVKMRMLSVNTSSVHLHECGALRLPCKMKDTVW